MQKSFFIVLIFVNLGILSCKSKQKPSIDQNALLKTCPEEWIQNKMPSTSTNKPDEYFILEGKRRELKEFDLAWIEKNCSIKPQIVQ